MLQLQDKSHFEIWSRNSEISSHSTFLFCLLWGRKFLHFIFTLALKSMRSVFLEKN